MEPTNKPPVAAKRGDATEIDFLPDADAIERSPLPPYLRITLHVMAGALLVLVLWACFSEVEKVVIAHGRMVNPLPNIIVQPLETSIIQKIEVRVGQVVRKGQVLATLDPTFAQADEAQLRTRLGSLDTQAAGLRAELSGQPGAPQQGGAADAADRLLQAQLASERQANLQAQLGKLDQNLARVAAAIETNRRDQQVLAQRVKSLGEMEAMQEKLIAQQFGAKIHLLEARDRRLEVEREMLLARNKEQELISEKAALQSERGAFSKSWRQKAMEDLLAATRERDGVNEQLQKADKRRQLVQLVAPVDAVVLDMAKLSQGSVVKEAEQMFTLVPLGADLEAEVQIDSLDIGYIKPGDAVHLKLDAFPFQKHGALDATVRTISEDAFRRDAANPGQGTDAYYQSRISFGQARLRKMAPQARLLPGMTLTAEIVVGKRSVMSYLLWPLTKAMDESIREP
ncbi:MULTISPECIES: HlyD family type I secretion periplasmic adaptor subunit [unclassified Janthinobacterium]|uniref:HlyD family type I secretion periplasmic adaptor subunit n=1 Tax=unclassified Janthinobacterium TaxID=2610881 RepID=UPI000347C9F1|nr:MULTISPECIES: HlyD family type I secretion periplasmic adaptor subunit [unclassified Janthinobacterium]MEC5163424.1 hemolysin D [Janthinobacterium sp. CG_S6]